MKKLFTAIAVSAAMTMTAGLCACAPSASGDKFDKLTTAEAVYGFSAASAGMIISSMTAAETVAPSNGVFASAAAESDGDMAVLDGYMTLVESLLSDGNFAIDTSDSDRTGFTDKTVVSYPDMQGTVTRYVMYYNKTLYDTETDGDETEEKYAISGVMVIDGVDYEISGKNKIETDGDESENKTELRVELGENDYMLVEHEVEIEDGEYEQEYGYSLYRDGELAEKSSFSYETEKAETELKMKSFKDGVQEVFKFEKETENGVDRIRIKVGEDSTKKTYIVTVNHSPDGEKIYSYKLV